MGKASTGAKAGLVSGVLTGVISGSIAYINLLVFRESMIAYFEELLEELPEEAQAYLSVETMYSMALNFSFIGALISFIILGLVFGALMGWGWDKLPGKGLVKGLVMGLVMFMVLQILSLVSSSIYMGGIGYGLHGGMWIYNMTSGLLVDILWGGVAAALYIKWSTKGKELQGLTRLN